MRFQFSVLNSPQKDINHHFDVNQEYVSNKQKSRKVKGLDENIKISNHINLPC